MIIIIIDGTAARVNNLMHSFKYLRFRDAIWY